MQQRRRDHLKVEGIIPAILTPLTKEQAFHAGAAEKLVNDLIDSGVHGIFCFRDKWRISFILARGKASNC